MIAVARKAFGETRPAFIAGSSLSMTARFCAAHTGFPVRGGRMCLHSPFVRAKSAAEPPQLFKFHALHGAAVRICFCKSDNSHLGYDPK